MVYVNWWNISTTDDTRYYISTTDNTSDDYIVWSEMSKFAPILGPEEVEEEKIGYRREKPKKLRRAGDLGDYDLGDLPEEELEKWV